LNVARRISCQLIAERFRFQTVKAIVSTFHLVNGITFVAAAGEITRGGQVIRLEPQPSAVLAALASRPGELVTHEELRRAVWGDATHVQLHDSLHYCVRQIRSALGDTAREPRYIETIPRRGYRMRGQAIACVSPSSRIRAVVRQRWAVRIAVAALVVTAAVALDRRPNNHHEIALKIVRALHNVVF
jgi:DNA-binding winged helix-turn-helix (wHTH) protein